MQVEKVKNLSIERDVLKRQSCDQHNIIADQEHEIKGLLLHVDRLSQCVEKQQVIPTIRPHLLFLLLPIVNHKLGENSHGTR